MGESDFRADLGQAGARPRALIVTVYGLYARASGGWLAVGDLIRLMEPLGVDEPALRSSISRLKRREILVAERRGGAAGYALSERARVILEEGDRRIFDTHRASLDEGWVLAVFSVPEAERRRRHALRSRLSWMGFGTVAPGVWVAPSRLETEARDVLQRHDLSGYVDLFHAQYLGFADLRAEVSTWWDLPELGRLYAEFHAAQSPVLRRWRRRRTSDRGQAFADYVVALTSWRRLPYLDPGLPPQLLPHDWEGARAGALFTALRGELEGPAREFFEETRGP